MNKNAFNDPDHRKFYKVGQLFKIPDFVLNAPAEESQEFTKVAVDLFGYPPKRLYPLNNKANTWKSGAIFELDKNAFEEPVRKVIDERIQTAFDWWGIKREFIPAQEKEAAAVYEIPIRVDDKVVETIKIKNKQQYKEAAEYLARAKAEIPFTVKQQFARGLYHAPESHKTSLPAPLENYIEKAAGFGMCDRNHAGQVILGRLCVMNRKYPEVSEMLTKWAMELPMQLTPAFLSKTAALLDMADRACNIVRYYGQGIETPEESLFFVTEKEARDLLEEMVPLQNGVAIHKTAILNNKEAVDDFFDNFYGEIPYSTDEERIAVIQSLPRDDAEAFQKCTGIK